MPERVWYRSLYWRIAFGFVALLAALLLVQVLLVLWLTDRLVGVSRTPTQLAEHVAQDLSAELTRDPQLAIETYVPEKFGHVYQPFMVLMADGRRGFNRPRAPLPPRFEEVFRGRGRGRDRWGSGSYGSSRAIIEPIVVEEKTIGEVAVPSQPLPVSLAVREVSRPLALSAAALLAIGAVAAALLIFRPVHRRLGTLEQAARALGEGRTEVRAAETGGDEVTSLARTFNRMADDLQTRAEALKDSDRSRRQLLADVSHELMTPLTAIRGYIETLGMPEVNLDAATRARYLHIVTEETHKLEAIIGDLLDLARLEGGGGSLSFGDVAVEELFARVQDRHGPAMLEKAIAIDAHIDPPGLTIVADRQRMEQALQNLAANALRHTPERGRVELRADAAADGVHLVIRDTGPGIPVQHLPHVFDRFYKADAARTTTAVASGSGLGLSIVKAIVEQHGGRIAVRNAPDGGAEFEIVLPDKIRGVGCRV